MQLTIFGDFVDDLSRSLEPGGIRGEARRPGLARPRGRLCSEATPNPRSAGGLSAGGASCRPPESPRTAPCEPPAHHAAAGLLVIFAALLAVSTAAQAQTQTLTTFVSNTGETPESNADKILAQSFRTGDNVDGYTVSEVQIWMAETAGKNTQVRIKQSANNEPGSTVAFLSLSTLVAISLNTFTVSGGTTLDPDATYWITLNEGVSDSTRAQFVTTFGNGESGAAGWSIGNTRLA